MQYVDLAPRASKRKNKTAPIVLTILFLALMGVLGTVVYGVAKVTKLNPVEIYTQITHPTPLKESDGFTNILILGTDTRDGKSAIQSGTLTDTILVLSINPSSKKVLMTSVPRDMYIPSARMKINSIYHLQGDNINNTQKAVEEVLGIPIHYHVLIGFDAFTNAIDILGGVDVVVPEAYEDFDYPITGMENATCGLDIAAQTEDAIANGEDPAFRFRCRFKHLKYVPGTLHLGGTAALEFARSRHGIGPLGTDFGRARRQQLIIEGVKEKLLSSQTLLNISKLQELYNNFKTAIDTNFDISELPQALVTLQKLKDIKPVSLVLSSWAGQEDGGGILVDSHDDTYGYIAIPRKGNGVFGEIQSLIREKMTAPDVVPSASPSAK